MPRDLVNIASPAPTPVANGGAARARGEGFAALVDADDQDIQKDETNGAAIDAAIVGLLGVPAPAATPGTTALAVETGQGTVGAKAQPATLAAALQAQADGLAASKNADARKTAGETLAAQGVVSLKGRTEIENVALSAPGKNALETPGKDSTAPVDAEGKLGGAGAADAKTADAKPADAKMADAKPAEARSGAGEQGSGVDMAAGESDAGSGQQPGEQGQRADAGRASAPAERIQTLQTSAAPATPSGQSAQAASGANPAAGAQVAAAVQVANQIASHAITRRTRFEVQLDPGDLGRVDVRLDIGQDGRVATRLIVERPETLDLLRNDARELSRTLEQAGFQLGQGGLAFQLKDGRQPTWGVERTPSAAESEAEDVAPVAAVYARGPATGAGGVDLKV